MLIQLLPLLTVKLTRQNTELDGRSPSSRVNRTDSFLFNNLIEPTFLSKAVLGGSLSWVVNS